MTDIEKVQAWAIKDCVELLDPEQVNSMLDVALLAYDKKPNDHSTCLKIALVFHEAALVFGLMAKKTDRKKGFAEKSYQILEKLVTDVDLAKDLKPWVFSYRASALALVSGEQSKLGLLSKAFELFEQAIIEFGDDSYLPRFLRGSVSENMPWIFWRKRQFAKIDFDSLVKRVEAEPDFMPDEIKSFTFWAWANQFHRNKNLRPKAVQLLKAAMILDPEKKAGYSRAKNLIEQIEKK